MRKLMQPMLSAALAALAILVPAPAFAGGYDTGEQDWDFLFQEKAISFESAVRYIAPQRTLNNIVGVFGPSIDATEAEAFAIPRLSMTARLGDTAACMASYREPWGGHADYGAFWTYAASAVEQHFSSQDYGLTCSARYQLSKGQLHFIGGVSYQTIDYELTRAIGVGAMARTAVSDSGIGWRAGVAFEIPEYALRASLIYNSEIDYRMSGTLSAGPAIIPIFGNISMPQSIELKVRSGIAPGWLAFGSVKWTDWSVTDNMWLCPAGVPACGAPAAVSALTLLWKDTFTVTLGVAHQFNDAVSLATSLTWDQGATQGFTSQTDTWVADATVVIIPNDNVELSFGANIGVMTGGALSTMVLPGGIPNPVGFTATFGNDVLYGFSAKAKLRF
ncbi:OmpP1/FadL family transporter [Zhengella sp. ZM62]|uniref:OmpP1/FadL family transporter n=1 Tax=Zhengella sedimenti TaxID=3390035 RepID=UPI0039766D81